MRTTSALYFGMVAVGIAVLLAASPARLCAQQTRGSSPHRRQRPRRCSDQRTGAGSRGLGDRGNN